MNRSACLHCAAAIAFAAMAAAGMGFAAAGPVTLIKVLGGVAIVAALGGCAIHALLLRAQAPDSWKQITRALRIDRPDRRVAQIPAPA